MKTRSKGKTIFIFAVIVIWLMTVLACTQSVIQPWQIQSTSQAYQLTETSISLVPRISSPAISPSPGLDTQSSITPSTPTESHATRTPEETYTPKPPILYHTQSGDTLPNIAARFGVSVDEINLPEGLTLSGSLLAPNLLLVIPDRLEDVTPQDLLLPDSEVVFSPSAIDFDVVSFSTQAGGYINDYSEWLTYGWMTGPEIINRVAIENSINPRMLLAILEYQSQWVYGQPSEREDTDYPLGNTDFRHKGLYRQLSWAVQQLSVGYYGWRAGILNELEFPDKSTHRMGPGLNAGSASLQYFFSKLYGHPEWLVTLYGNKSFNFLYEEMYGNPFLLAKSFEPLYPPNLKQPDLELPFKPGKIWSLTGGPHSAWGPDGALAALDFAPASMEHGCVGSQEVVTASAAGTVVRSQNGVVVIDLDGDGYEQTGWSILYLHIASKERVQKGALVDVNDQIGYPSCEGGVATGTHVHIARKYNGEWILADGPIPFVLSGYRAYSGEKPYLGKLINNDKEVIASVFGDYYSNIKRTE